MTKTSRERRQGPSPHAYAGISGKIYSGLDLYRVGQALELKSAAISAQATLFEAAAFRFLTWGSTFENRTPTELKRKLKSINSATRALLKQLGIPDVKAAVDGPGDRELFDVLTFTQGSDEGAIVDACAHLGRLAEILEAIDASLAIKTLTERALEERAALARQTVPPGNRGDIAINEWVADLLSIYTMLTGKQAGTSVGAPGRSNERKAAGPVIRFLKAAAVPLERWLTENRPDLEAAELERIMIPRSAEALRQRIRAVRRSMIKPKTLI
jgi:hypothetical protein